MLLLGRVPFHLLPAASKSDSAQRPGPIGAVLVHVADLPTEKLPEMHLHAQCKGKKNHLPVSVPIRKSCGLCSYKDRLYGEMTEGAHDPLTANYG